MSVKDYLYRYEDRCTYLYWSIRSLVNIDGSQLELRNKMYYLNWRKLDQGELEYIVEKYGLNRTVTHEDDIDLNTPAFDHAIEISGDAVHDNHDMLVFRDRFEPLSQEQIRLVEGQMAGCIGISMSRHYFEDEDGHSISLREIHERMSGMHCVIMGDYDSVQAAIGFTPIRDSAEWGEAESNTVAHYLSVVEQIDSSRWSSSRMSYTSRGRKYVSSELPTIHDIRSVSVLFRQLYSKNERLDNLFAKATTVYMNAVSNEVKCKWVEYESERFGATLRNPPFGIDPENSGESFLEAFGYGYRIFHAFPGRGGDKDLAKYMERYGEEKVIFVYNDVLRGLFVHVVNVYKVIKADFAKWVADGSCPRPSILNLEHLIGI